MKKASAQPRQHIERFESMVALCGKPFVDLGRDPDCFSCLYSAERQRRRASKIDTSGVS